MPRVLETAIRIAVAERGVAVVVIPGDIALQDAPTPTAATLAAPQPPVVRPSDAELDALAALLDARRAVTMMCGAGCAGAHAEVVALAERAAARRSSTRCAARSIVEYDNPFDVGMTGLIGFASGYARDEGVRHAAAARHRLPLPAVLSREAPGSRRSTSAAESLGNRMPARPRRASATSAPRSRRCCRGSKRRPTARFLDAALAHYQQARADLDKLAEGRPSGEHDPSAIPVAALVERARGRRRGLHLRRRHADASGPRATCR